MLLGYGFKTLQFKAVLVTKLCIYYFWLFYQRNLNIWGLKPATDTRKCCLMLLVHPCHSCLPSVPFRAQPMLRVVVAWSQPTAKILKIFLQILIPSHMSTCSLPTHPVGWGRKQKELESSQVKIKAGRSLRDHHHGQNRLEWSKLVCYWLIHIDWLRYCETKRKNEASIKTPQENTSHFPDLPASLQTPLLPPGYCRSWHSVPSVRQWTVQGRTVVSLLLLHSYSSSALVWILCGLQSFREYLLYHGACTSLTLVFALLYLTLPASLPVWCVCPFLSTFSRRHH